MPPPLLIPWFRITGLRLPGLPEALAVQPFAIVVAIGVLAGARLAERRAARLGLKRAAIADLSAHVIVAGFVLGHVFDRLISAPGLVAAEPWDLLMPWRSQSAYAGFVGGLVGGLVWKRRRGLPLTLPLDQVAFGLPLAWLFARVGCFLVHDHPGTLTTFFLAVNDYQYGDLPVGPRHDLGLYEALWSLLTLVLFVRLDRKPRPHGTYIGWVAVAYAPVRFGLDFLNALRPHAHGITGDQYVSLLAFALGAYALRRAYRRPVERIPQGLLAGNRVKRSAIQRRDAPRRVRTNR